MYIALLSCLLHIITSDIHNIKNFHMIFTKCALRSIFFRWENEYSDKWRVLYRVGRVEIISQIAWLLVMESIHRAFCWCLMTAAWKASIWTLQLRASLNSLSNRALSNFFFSFVMDRQTFLMTNCLFQSPQRNSLIIINYSKHPILCGKSI